MSPTGYAAAANIRHVSRSCVRTRSLCVRRAVGSAVLRPLPLVGGVLVSRLVLRCANDHDELLLEKAFAERSSLVDPASSHMLVSKIKPCMSQCMPN